MISFKGHRIEKAIILTCVRWYLAYPLSYRNLADGQDLHQDQGTMAVPLPRR